MTTQAQERPELEVLEYFVGNWIGVGRFLATAHNPERPIGRIELDAEMLHRNHWLTQRLLEVDVPSELLPLDATRMWGYEASSGMFVCEWFDANRRRGTVHSPGWKNDRLSTTGTAVSGGRSVALREVFTRHGDGEFVHVGEMDFGEGWVVTDEQVFRRTIS
jgi:hypothetical protein